MNVGQILFSWCLAAWDLGHTCSPYRILSRGRAITYLTNRRVARCPKRSSAAMSEAAARRPHQMNSNRAAALFGLAGLRHADARDQRRCKLVNHLPILRSDQTSVRLPFRLNQPVTIRSRLVRLLVSFKKNAARAFRVLAPTLVALSFAGVAHAQGTMDFSGARTLMGNVQNVCYLCGRRSTTLCCVRLRY